MDKKHAIFKSAVQVSNQKDCDVALDICKRYELPMWKDASLAFKYVDYGDDPTYLQYQEDYDDEDHIGFYIDNIDGDKEEGDFNFVSIKTFEILAEDYNPQFKNIDDILTKIKELNNILNNK